MIGTIVEIKTQEQLSGNKVSETEWWFRVGLSGAIGAAFGLGEGGAEKLGDKVAQWAAKNNNAWANQAARWTKNIAKKVKKGGSYGAAKSTAYWTQARELQLVLAFPYLIGQAFSSTKPLAAMDLAQALFDAIGE